MRNYKKTEEYYSKIFPEFKYKDHRIQESMGLNMTKFSSSKLTLMLIDKKKSETIKSVNIDKVNWLNL